MNGRPTDKASPGSVGPRWHKKLFLHLPYFLLSADGHVWDLSPSGRDLSPHERTALSGELRGARGTCPLLLVPLTPASLLHTPSAARPWAPSGRAGREASITRLPPAAGSVGTWFLTASCLSISVC